MSALAPDQQNMSFKPEQAAGYTVEAYPPVEMGQEIVKLTYSENVQSTSEHPVLARVTSGPAYLLINEALDYNKAQGGADPIIAPHAESLQTASDHLVRVINNEPNADRLMDGTGIQEITTGLAHADPAEYGFKIVNGAHTTLNMEPHELPLEYSWLDPETEGSKKEAQKMLKEAVAERTAKNAANARYGMHVPTEDHEVHEAVRRITPVDTAEHSFEAEQPTKEVVRAEAGEKPELMDKVFAPADALYEKIEPRAVKLAERFRSRGENKDEVLLKGVGQFATALRVMHRAHDGKHFSTRETPMFNDDPSDLYNLMDKAEADPRYKHVIRGKLAKDMITALKAVEEEAIALEEKGEKPTVEMIIASSILEQAVEHVPGTTKHSRGHKESAQKKQKQSHLSPQHS